jgi:hypothetical protein
MHGCEEAYAAYDVSGDVRMIQLVPLGCHAISHGTATW